MKKCLLILMRRQMRVMEVAVAINARLREINTLGLCVML